MKRTISICSLLVLIACLLLLAPSAHLQAQVDKSCFQETGFCISGRIREYWIENDGLRVFGYPITPQREEMIEGQPVQVQWFERNRLELHPENDPPFDVLLGRLGAEELERLTIEPPQTPERNDCRYFPETGFNVCYDFLRAWQASGLSFDSSLEVSDEESLALFGLPLTGELQQTLSDGQQYTVQYFERARFEYHAENEPPYDVLFGLLGKEMHSREAADPPDAADLPDGRVVFASNRTGNSDIFVMNADGSELTNLTSHEAADYLPAWSPDGTQIAFFSERSGERNIYVMDADGANLTQITTLKQVHEFAWSPDGSQIAFAGGGSETPFVHVINADGTGQMMLTDMVSASPSWSPDSTRIAFSAREEDEEHAIYIINSDGTNLHKPFDLPAGVSAGSVEWSPDGSSFAFASYDDEAGTHRIARIDANGTNLVWVVEGGGINRPQWKGPIVWSPNGTRMVFTRSWSRGHSYHRDIFVAPRDGSDAQHIEAKKENHDASWVSEDTLVLSAFRTFYDPNTDSLDAVGHDLYLVNVDGSGLTLLHHSPAKDSQPDWWP